MRKLFNLPVLSAILFTAFIPVNPQPSEKRVVAYAKKIRVSVFNSALPKQTLEIWLKSITGADTVVRWERNDCGDQTGEPGDGSNVNPRLCAELGATLPDERRVGIQIEVGTFKQGIFGKPAIAFIYVSNGDASEYPADLRKLAELLGGKQKSQ